jgi:hypothetical protein
MKTVAAAVVFLAGATVFAGGLVADALLIAAGKDVPTGYRGMLLGGAIAFIGVVLLVVGWLSDHKTR